MGKDKIKIASVVLTYNRKELLKNCLEALMKQSYPIDLIIVVDNASTDRTFEFLKTKGYLNNSQVKYLSMEENAGSAGGFGAGMKYGYEKGYDFFWLMDDDTVSQKEALEKLVESWNSLKEKGEKIGIIGSVAISGLDSSKLSWVLRRKKENKFYRHLQDFQEAITEVDHLPYGGAFINKEIIKEVGCPDKDFFLWLDDVEYCYRVRQTQRKIFAVKNSIVCHPLGATVECSFRNKKVFVKSSSQPPWKDYYDARNYILLIRKHGLGIRRFLPSGELTLIFSLLKRDQKLKRALYYLRGFIDGLLSKKGKTI